MTTKQYSLSIKSVRLGCLIVYISLLLTGSTDAFAEISLSATRLIRLLGVQHNINPAFSGKGDLLTHFIAYNALKTDNLISRTISVPNTPDTSGGQAKEGTQTTESFRKPSLSRSTPSGQEKGQDRGGQKQKNEDRLRLLLATLKQTMTQKPDWLLILLWDIDGTLIYEDIPETGLYAELADTLGTLRENKQVLLIYNTARDYSQFPFWNRSEPFPEPDIVIAGEGSRYFFNDFINIPVFDNKVPVFIRKQGELHFNPKHWELIRPVNCDIYISARSLQHECPLTTFDYPFEEIYAYPLDETVETLKKLAKAKPKYRYWQHSGAYNTIIFFSYHKFINKGASFSRLIKALSKEFPAFRNKIKIVISAGDSLPDTSMMHPDMHFPFDESYKNTANTPRLPLNTVFAGAVLSKGGELEPERFDFLFEDIEIIKSKTESLLGILEGTVTLLLKQIKLLGN